jgi:hypothetical protein
MKICKWKEIIKISVYKWKMRPAETIPEMGRGRIKENDGGVNSTMIYLTYCKNFYKSHNIPL